MKTLKIEHLTFNFEQHSFLLEKNLTVIVQA